MVREGFLEVSLEGKMGDIQVKVFLNLRWTSVLGDT